MADSEAVDIRVVGRRLLGHEFKSGPSVKVVSCFISIHFRRRQLGPFNLPMYTKMAIKQKYLLFY